MKRSTRRAIFLICVGIFVLASYTVLLYAQGYQYSFTENRFVLTGTLYVRSNTDADVYLNDHLVGRTSLIGNSFNISGLEPGQYSVRLERDGYYSWQKTAIVEDGMLTEFSRILLVPKDKDEQAKILEDVIPTPTPSPSLSPPPTKKPVVSNKPSPTPSPSPESLPEYFLADSRLFQRTDDGIVQITNQAQGFELAKNKRKLLWWNKDEIWVIWLEATTYQPYHKVADRELVAKFPAEFKEVMWFNNDHILADTDTQYKIIETDTRGGINIFTLSK